MGASFARRASAALAPVPLEACVEAQAEARAICSAVAWIRASWRLAAAFEGPANEGKSPFRIRPKF